jgi:hypothetical protein
MKSLLDLIKALYGPKAISSTIGTRTNVIRLPSGKLQKYLSKELNIEAASDNAAQNAYNEMKELIPEVAKMNDSERLIFEGNLRRLKNKLDASGLIQEETVSSGVASLQSKVEQLKQAGKELEKVTGQKATLTDVLNDLGSSQQSMSRMQDVGLVRSTARQILINDIKAGKIKNITVSEAINMGEPLDPFRQIYGEGALEQLDSLIPNFRGLKTEMEAEKLARSKFKFEPDENRLPGSVSIEEGKKAEQEFGINKPAKVSDFKAEATKRTSIDDLIDEYNANQDRLILTDEEGGTLIGYQEFQQLQKRNEEIAKALEAKGISSKIEETPQAEIIPFRKKPTEPEGKANGGRIGYAEGTPAAGLVVTNWEGPWTGPQILGGPKPGEYANQRSGITSIQSNRVLKPEYRNGIPIGLVMPQDFYYMDAPSVTNSSSESNPNLSLKDQYLNRLSSIQSSGSSYGDFKNLLESNLQKKANGGSMGLDYLTGMGPSKGYADGGRIGFKIGSGKKLLNVISKFDDLKVKHKEAFKAHDQIFNVDINDKIAPDMIAESMAEMKGKDYFSLSQKEQSDLYKKALAYVDDVRMIKKQNKMSISNEMNQAKQEGIQKTNKMIELGLDPSNSKDYDKFLEMESIKQKYGNMISDDLLQKIMVDDNPQRKAEALASIDEAMKMQEKGIAPEEIINIMKNTTRTKQADGGSIGLNYLMGF